MTTPLRVGVLGASGSWHSRGLLAALAARGHAVVAIPATRLQSEVDERGEAHVRGPDGILLDTLDLLVVRGLPRGSLEQVIFRMDALHVLAEEGVRCVNSPRAIERTVDKSWASALLARAGVPTPPTIVCERYEGAMAAFEQLGGDVVVKPLFGAMGNGIVRVEDRDVAHRVFRALELERAAYYVQRTIAPAGRRNLRALVVAGEVAGAMERVSDSWRANVARGAHPRAVALSEDEHTLALAAAGALEVDVAGVDLLVAPDGEMVVLEVNGIPGWQALQSVCEDDLTARVVGACEALVTA
ncbi:MAG TPA: RimK family alpha-L-glutamate ligase [Solirubrobacteraceae bacterium]|nr:RimK family alpha-L-glutamate ligase [Solirubrobacteraceae bacterium]